MKKTRFFILVPIIAIATVGLLYYTATKVLAQNQYATDIAERLRLRNVPIKQVVVLRHVPYVVEIALQSSSNDDTLSLDDNWFMQLARREATFAYRIGTGLSSFKLTVYNTQGDLIYSTQTYLYPEDLSQQLTSSQLPKVDNLTAKEIVKEQLNLGGLSLDLLDVISEGIGSSGQILLIQLSAEDLKTANQSLPKFLCSFFQMLETVNDEHGTYLVLCYLRLTDSQGNVLLDYTRDMEGGSTQWTAVEGLYDEWYPHPKDEDISIPTPTVPIEAYPPPPAEAKPIPLSTPYP